ncbi:MAG: ATP-binding protein, partial [Deltaproteobacteria bacterium]|nr:ATP-binding protein [Deltaproteobacteria bacterium]
MRRFDLNCVVRVLLLSGSIGLLAYLLFKTEFVAASIFLALMIVYQIFSLIRFVTKTNRDLNRFLLSIKHSDFSQSFTTRLEGSGFEELNTAFSEVTREFQRAKIEKEEHFRFLQTII